MSVLVTGGAGYIGSHITYGLLDHGERVIVLDNLSTGLLGLVPKDATFICGDAGDPSLVSQVLARHQVDSVIHLAGSASTPESVAAPLDYYANNTSVSRNLIQTCLDHGLLHFVFSSSAAVYAPSNGRLLKETDRTSPASPYGRSKLMTEWMLEDACRAHSAFRSCALRYFNVAGADPLGRTGQCAINATHLIKRACQTALGKTTHLDIFGDDYPTVDGTGVRDYIHVADLVDAHLLALNALRRGAPCDTFNCGYGKGFSVLQVVQAIEQLTQLSINVQIRPRRPGDLAQVVANPSKIKSRLGWRAKHASLAEIVLSTLEWERRPTLAPTEVSEALC